MSTLHVHIEVPDEWALNAKVGKHVAQRLRRPSHSLIGQAESISIGRGSRLIRLDDGLVLVNRAEHAPAAADRVLLSRVPLAGLADGGCLPRDQLRWAMPAPSALTEVTVKAASDSVLESWRDQFRFQAATGERPGLRGAQLGALHGLLAHWSMSTETATVVLPTGTGKTDTMISALVAERISPLLVVVPTRSLRGQIARKFATLGVLPHVDVVPADIALPTVATLQGRIVDLAELDTLLSGCHVLITTMAGIVNSPTDVRKRLAAATSHLFIDEAHHVPARTWSDFREAFPAQRVVQFTATPFRGDNKLVSGRIAYRYPLRRAQQDGYFQTVRLRHVFDYDPAEADVKIAKAAVDQLQQDLAAGLDHVVMARASTIGRAEALVEVYRQVTDQPLAVVHSRKGAGEQKEALAAVVTRAARIVICVDMLGEGYDLPALKIAALHDAHRGLGVTLQFIGRFTRTAEGIGPATVIANTADPKISEALEELYSQDADWNVLLQELADGAVSRQLRRVEFLDGFDDALGEIALQNIQPRVSAVAYRVPAGTWHPGRIVEAIGADRLHFSSINAAENVAVLVLRDHQPVGWGEIGTLQDVIHDLIIMFFDRQHGLLFVHSSDTRRYHKDLAEAVGGDDVELVQGMTVFRILHGINRLIVANLGLRHALGRSVRYTMYAGGNVHEGLTEQNFHNRMTSNLFGFGFADGDRASAGCSYKGRMWCYRVAEDISEWVTWCRHIGGKLVDPSIDPAAFLRTTMRVEPITARPSGLVPLAIEWSANLWLRSEEAVLFRIGEHATTLLDVGIDIVERSPDGPLRFRVFTDEHEARFEVALSDTGAAFKHLSGPNIEIRHGRTFVPLATWLDEEPPLIRFHDGAQLVRDLLISAPTVERPFDDSRIDAWDWTGVDLSKESQGAGRRPDSIQRRVIEHLLAQPYDIIFDDDDTNEAADIIAIRVADERLVVRLFHCKYAHDGRPGRRVSDLYEVCGQAQRSVHWKGDRARLIQHMIQRESLARQRDRTRFERGNLEQLALIGRRLRDLDADFEVVIVQPGVQKSNINDGQRHLFASTQLYLSETYAVPLSVIASA
ncbi:DEAD/DEAH box helicase [Micromonospora chalcea]|uniref:DEAD/DEAH box helicase n=1 Tax=Micromonospora chalcea TaxID=1874 RepID=UPI001656AEFE|nr:DEAD/DEAH box helicase family protein [Micromonospora chalcea]MBC8990873.1 DEAD/DEAH box helicase family protein [Micromonospora chalcea]